MSGHSLGVVNRSLKELIGANYLDESVHPTVKAITEFKRKQPKRAIILAAGFGMRMLPINTEMPKGLLEVNGEPLIERTIKQLHEVGIKEIYVVVGFMKERYEYLIDEYGVELVVNADYAVKNNLHSANLVKEHLENAYIVPCDIWCDRNPFHQHELYSWYMVSDLVDNESNVRVNRKMELVTVPKNSGGNAMIGICYLVKGDADVVADRIEKLCQNQRYDGAFWEEALYNKDRMIVTARVVHSADVVEINTYEQLREIDCDSNQLKTDTIQIICSALQARPEEVTDITVLKKEMTNRSFLFACKGKKYIMRIPGEGTDCLINRRQEAAVYRTIDGKHICDDIAYINPENGYKITEFLEGARVCDPFNYEDVKKCMKRLRSFHELRLKVNHEFDIFGQMEFYETLWEGTPSIYKDSNQWKLISGNWYFFNGTGYMMTGWLSSNEQWYYLANSGEMLTAQWIDGGYYVKVSGEMARNEWVDQDQYYVDENGKWDPERGKTQGGWKSDTKGKWYQNSNGTYPVNEWKKIDGKWFYFDEHGYMKTGWIYIDGQWYFLNSEGIMCTNQWIDNTYYVKNSGEMARNEWVDQNRYYVDGNGEWVRNYT